MRSISVKLQKKNSFLFRATISFLCIILLSSCGFKPVYKKDSNPTYNFLQSIKVVALNSIDGVEYINHLKNILPTNGNIKYKLETTLSYIKDHSIIQKNSDAVREFVTIKVTYKLIDLATDEILISSGFSRLSSYSTNFSPYSNQSNQENVKKLLAIMSAEEVRDRIILFLENN